MHESSCTFYPPAIDALVYMVVCHGVWCVGIGAPFAVWLYYVGRRHTSLCIVLAFIVPLSIPLLLNYRDDNIFSDLEELLLQDSSRPAIWIGKFVASCFGFGTAFKLCNIASQQGPEGYTTSLRSFMEWFLILPEPQFVKGKTRTLTRTEIQGILVQPIAKVVLLSVMLSILKSTSLEVGDDDHTPSMFESRGRYLQESLNGWLHIWYLYAFLSLFLDLSIVLTMPATGFQAMNPSFQNPLLESRSLQEFWGTRWNLPVQCLLQRTSFVPLRKQGYSRPVSAFVTFLVSGLLHEYVFWTHNFDAYKHPGLVTVFFAVMGLLIIIENYVWTRLVPASMQKFVGKFIPSFAVAFGLTILSAIPVKKYFLKSWLEAGMLEAVSTIIPHFVCQ